MLILADENVPEEYVFALRGDGHDVVYSRDIRDLGPAAPDEELLAYAEMEGYCILSTDVKDFGERDATVPIFVATQEMTGGEVRGAIARIDALSFDPSETAPIWLSGL